MCADACGPVCDSVGMLVSAAARILNGHCQCLPHVPLVVVNGEGVAALSSSSVQMCLLLSVIVLNDGEAGCQKSARQEQALPVDGTSELLQGFEAIHTA